MRSQSPNQLNEQKIYVNEIVFYSRSEVSLFGFIEQGGRYYETEYLIGRKNLQLLLSQSKEGVEILWHIEKLFVLPHQVPATINLVDLFGTTQMLEAGNIELENPYYKGGNDEVRAEKRTGLLFVQAVRPLPSAPHKAINI